MTRLDSLRVNILNMTPIEVSDYVTRVRADRRLTKERPVVKRQRKVASVKAQASAAKATSRTVSKVSKALDSLSEGARAALLRELGDAEGNSSIEDKDQG